MPGNVVIPNTFATATGLVPASQLDADFDAVKVYVDAREVTLGALGARPVAGTSGRWYYANDTAQLFVDSGAAWVQVGGPSGLGLGGVRVLFGTNNTTTPATQYDVTCEAVQLRSPGTGQTAVVLTPGTRTNNILTAGSTPNGRDQAPVFPANGWIHLYYIWDGTTLATLTSTSNPNPGPTLPPGYTHWAYIGALRLNASTQFSATTTMRGAWTYYNAAQVALTGGASTVAAAVSVATLVPPNAVAYQIDDFGWALITDASGVLEAALEIHVQSGVLHRYMARPSISGFGATINTRTTNGSSMILPHIAQQFFYKWTITTGTAPSANITVSGYQVANGG